MRLKAIVLAAGQAQRFGGAKLTAPFHGRPMLASTLDVVLQAPVEEAILVTGGHAEAVEACARTCAQEAIATGRLRIHRAAHADDGMGASLSAAIAAAMPADGVFVFLADMPAVSPSVAHMLVRRLGLDIDAVAPRWRGERGHPVLFGPALFPRLAVLRADEGARRVLDSLGARLAMVDAPDGGVLLDIDTVDDLAAAGTL